MSLTRKPSIFLSYSRRDEVFVQRLYQDLIQKGYNTFLDKGPMDLLVGELWWEKLQSNIRSRDVFLFVVSENSLNSKTCLEEVSQAQKHAKRLVPVWLGDLPWRDVTEKAPWLSEVQKISFSAEEGYDDCFRRLEQELSVDLRWAQLHTSLLVDAHEWMLMNRSSDMLLRGEKLREAEVAMADAPSEGPLCASLPIRELVTKSRLAEKNRRKTALIWIALGLAVTVVAGLSGLGLHQKAETRKAEADAEKIMTATQARKTMEQSEKARSEAGRGLIERSKNFIADNGVPRIPEVNFFAARALGFQTGNHSGLTGELAAEFPVLVDSAKDKPAYQQALGLSHYGMLPVLPVWSAPVVRQHSEPILAHFRLPHEPTSTASIDKGGRIKIWDTESGELIREVSVGRSVTCACLAGTKIAIGTKDGRILLVPTEGSGEPTVLANPVDEELLNVSSDKAGMLICGLSTGGKVRVWDANSSARVFDRGTPEEALHSASINPSGRGVMLSGTEGLRFVEISSGKEMTFSTGKPDPVGGVQFSNDGNWLACSDTSNMTYAFDTGSGRLVHTLATDGHSFRCAFDETSERLAVLPQYGAASGISVWSLTDGRKLHELPRRRGANTVNSLTFSSDGTSILTGSGDANLEWNSLVKGKKANAWKSPQSNEVHMVSFNPNGKLLAACGSDGTATLFDLTQGGEAVATVSGRHPASNLIHVAFPFEDPRKMLVLDGAGDLLVFSPKSPMSYHALGEKTPRSLAYDVSRMLVAICYDGGVIELRSLLQPDQVLSETTLLPERSKEKIEFAERTGLPLYCMPMSMDFDQDSGHLGVALACRDSEHRVFVLSVPDLGKVASHTNGDQDAYTVAFDYSRSQIISGGVDGTIRFADQQKMDGLPLTLKVGDSAITAFALSPNQKNFAAGDHEGAVYLFDKRGEIPYARIQAGVSAVCSIHYAPDGNTLAIGCADSSCRIWNVSSQIIAQNTRAWDYGALMVSPSGKEHYVWSAMTAILPDGAALETFDTGTSKRMVRHLVPSFRKSSFAISPDGEVIAIGGEALRQDNIIPAPDERVGVCILWDTATRKEAKRWIPHLRSVTSVAVSTQPNRMIATGSYDGLALWNADAEELPLWRHRLEPYKGGNPLKIESVDALAFSPDNRVLACGARSGTLVLLDVRNGERLSSENVPGGVYALRFSQDGKVLLGGGFGRIFELKVDNNRFTSAIRILPVKGAGVEVIDISSTGKVMAMTNDGNVSIWNDLEGPNPTVLFTAAAHDSIARTACWMADGTTLWTCGGNGILRWATEASDYSEYLSWGVSERSRNRYGLKFTENGIRWPGLTRRIGEYVQFPMKNLNPSSHLSVIQGGESKGADELLFWRYLLAGNWMAARSCLDPENDEQIVALVEELAMNSVIPTRSIVVAAAKLPEARTNKGEHYDTAVETIRKGVEFLEKANAD